MVKRCFRYLLALSLYGFVWTITALVVIGVLASLFIGSLAAAPTWVFFGGIALFTLWPLNLIWLGWVALFGSFHIAWLHLGPEYNLMGESSPARLSILFGIAVGVIQAVFAAAIATELSLPPAADSLRNSTDFITALIIYSPAAFAGSYASGYVLSKVGGRVMPFVFTR